MTQIQHIMVYEIITAMIAIMSDSDQYSSRHSTEQKSSGHRAGIGKLKSRHKVMPLATN